MFWSEVTDTGMGPAGKPGRLATAARSNKSAPIDSGSLYKIAHVDLSIDLRFIVQNDT
jgi:hypothetical protein